ncbi:MAG: cupin domain-containing protein [Endomicrobiales bacterium]|nr:cupin domain-containing protein [Endomicrobiales bacterium]
MNNVKKIISSLKLKPHPKEGGYFIETYRAKEKIGRNCLPKRYKSSRPFSTAIYYLLTPGTFSAMHRLASDEIFHFYFGDPVEMLQLFPDGSGKIVLLGSSISNGIKPQVVVPRNVWQGSRLIKGGRFALLGTTMSPGFDYSDYEHGKRSKLVESYPYFKEIISSLTKL